MKYLYIFPHPDDESFGPARAIAHQKRQGDEVHLLTLTKGGATKQRFKFNYSIAQMGEVRFKEMEDVAKVLQLDSMQVLDFPDSGLKELDPRELEKAIARHIGRIRPGIVITYPVHGISGFHDHLVTHAVVKRVYLQLRENGAGYLQRLAFFTIPEASVKGHEGVHRLHFSTDEEIDCAIPLNDADHEAMRKALYCYKTYQEMIEKTGVLKGRPEAACFEIFQERFDPPLNDLAGGLPASSREA